jgi:SPP1 family phage portal protein
MNKQRFQDLAKGQYGRKIAYVDFSEVTPGNVLKIFNEGVSCLNWNRPAIRYLHDYYKGDQPALYRQKTVRDDINNPVVENHAFEIVAFKNAQTYGEPVQCVSLKNDDKTNNAVDKLNDYNRIANKRLVDIECGEWTSSVGTGFKAIQRTKPPYLAPYRLVAPSPMNTVVVYSAITFEPLLSIQQFKDEDGNQYYQCFSAFLEYIYKNGKMSAGTIHAFGGIPIVEYPNNADRISDIELVITMLDGINEIQSNRIDSVEQFVQAYFKFLDCDVDEDVFKKMKMQGAIVVKSNNGSQRADVSLIQQELNQEGTQVAKDDLLGNVQSILAIPNREGNTGGDTQGAVSLRNGWDFARQRANLKDPYVVRGDRELSRVALKVISQAITPNPCDIDETAFDVHIVHSPTDNLLVKSEALEILLRSGIHPLVAIRVVGLWADPEKVFLQSKGYLDALWKTVDQMIEENNLQGEVEKAKQIVGGLNGKNN